MVSQTTAPNDRYILMRRLERKIERAAARVLVRAVKWALLAPFKFLNWLFAPRRKKKINSSGYVVLVDKGELEHRYIAIQLLGRKLKFNEVVHHINGVKVDNKLSNLCLMNREKHEHFHSWLRWKKEKSGRYPSLAKQKNILEEEYNGTLLENVRRNPAQSIPKAPRDRKQLFANLKAIRKVLATDKELPLYMIFSNATLEEMAEKLPATEDEMLLIKGVGPVKMNWYGNDFLNEIRRFKNQMDRDCSRRIGEQ